MPTELPKFICKLHNLETLDIRRTNVREIPKEIYKLRKLRHLLGNYLKLFQLKNGLGGMTSLQSLRQVKLSLDDDAGEELISELGKLKQIRNLSLSGVKEKQGSALCSSINKMTNLEKLTIDSKYGEVIDLPTISSLPMLRKLCLDGKLKKFPQWIPQLQSLVKLSLKSCELIDDPFKPLHNMPHLLFLDLHNAYDGKSCYVQDGGFQQLKEINLTHLHNLNSIVINKGALLSLEYLKLVKIPKLQTVPAGIQHLEKLEVLDLSYMSDEFNECIVPNGKPAHPVIRHVPLVKITTKDGTRDIHHSRCSNS